MIQIAVMGYGTVGSGVVEVLSTNQASIDKRVGEEVRVKYVLDLRDFPGDPVESVLVHDFETIVNDPEVKVVVEVMEAWSLRIPLPSGVCWLEKAYAHPTRPWWQPTVRSFFRLRKTRT